TVERHGRVRRRLGAASDGPRTGGVFARRMAARRGSGPMSEHDYLDENAPWNGGLPGGEDHPGQEEVPVGEGIPVTEGESGMAVESDGAAVSAPPAEIPEARSATNGQKPPARDGAPAEVIEVVFKGRRRAYYANPRELPVREQDYVVVQAERGEDLGRVHHTSEWVKRTDFHGPLRQV